MIRLILLAILVALPADRAFSASFTTKCEGNLARLSQACTVKLTGKIERGDAAALRKVLREGLKGDWFYGTLLLDSLGGEVKEALLVASVVREALLATSTVDMEADPTVRGARNFWPCVSACALIWFAGVDRNSYAGQNKTDGCFGIGLHRPYFSADTYSKSPALVAEAQQEMTMQVREFLRREQVPEQFIQRMLDRSSREVYWLDESGDASALTGRAPWFEEMMIARCGFDPAYDRESEATIVRGLSNEKRETSPESESYRSWRRNYNGCEYQTRRSAQAHMRR